jgi:hypothetical protein
MNTAVLHTTDTLRTATGRGMLSLMQRLRKLSPRHRPRPHWSRVPDRVWRRNSALLTYLHEAQTGER